MNALEFAETIEQGGVPFYLDQVAATLRKQHEAIVKLRLALYRHFPIPYDSGYDDALQVLEETKEIAK